jgi:hypothetical protein
VPWKKKFNSAKKRRDLELEVGGSRLNKIVSPLQEFIFLLGTGIISVHLYFVPYPLVQ